MGPSHCSQCYPEVSLGWGLGEMLLRYLPGDQGS